ncbi:hypothetical protein [Gordonia aichiensis]|uniref:hypothetical protein n=1 Tax=Gordonia aichiensis TaxID=36820 RepID=UPI0032646F98
MNTRYSRFDGYADLGEGADEFEGPRRFTRLTEKAAVHPTKNATATNHPNTHKENEHV